MCIVHPFSRSSCIASQIAWDFQTYYRQCDVNFQQPQRSDNIVGAREYTITCRVFGTLNQCFSTRRRATIGVQHVRRGQKGKHFCICFPFFVDEKGIGSSVIERSPKGMRVRHCGARHRPPDPALLSLSINAKKICVIHRIVSIMALCKPEVNWRCLRCTRGCTSKTRLLTAFSRPAAMQTQIQSL